MDYFSNVWVYTIVGGALATVLGTFLYKKFFPTIKTKETTGSPIHVKNVINNNVIGGVVETQNSAGNSATNRESSSKVVGYKATARLLFIDNHPLKDKIQNLNSAGWKNVSYLKDLKDTEAPEVRDADVIFVDYKGIGSGEKEQGLAVIGALKNRYLKSKWLILFTAYNVPVNTFEKGADDYLAKNSGIYEMEQKIIKGLQSLGR